MKFLKRYRWALFAGGAVLLVAGFLLFRPDTLFVDDVIDESLAEAFTTTEEAGTGPAGTPTTAPANAAPDDAELATDTVPAAPTTTVPQASEPVTPTTPPPDLAPDAAPDDAEPAVAPTTTVPAAPTTTVPAAPTTTVPQPSEPVKAATGSFFGIDHSAEGTATVYEQDGRYVLRFEDDTDIQNGPDLYVWLLETDEYDGGDPGAVIDLGRLKGNVGGQNYELPPEYDPDIHRYVLIWCERFSTPFAAAPLA